MRSSDFREESWRRRARRRPHVGPAAWLLWPRLFVQLCGHVNEQAEGGARGRRGSAGSTRDWWSPRSCSGHSFSRRNWEGPAPGGPPCSTHTPKAVRTARVPHEPGRVAASPLGGGGQRAAVPATGASVPTTEVLVARVARPPPTAMLTWQGASAPTPRGVPGHARRRLPAQAVRRAGQRHVPVGRVWWLAVTAPALCAWPSAVPRDEDVSTPSGAGPRIRPPRDGAQGVTLTPVLAGSCPQLGGTCLTPTAPGA